MLEKVAAEPYVVCEDCPARGNLSADEHSRRCYGKITEAIGAAACGKKQIPTKARDIHPNIFETDY